MSTASFAPTAAKKRLRDSQTGSQPLKSMPVAARRSRLPKVIINDMDTLSRPAQQDGSLHQTILQLRAFLVMTDLAKRRLAYIDIRELGTVRRRNAFFRERCRCQHDASPTPGVPPVASVGEAGRHAEPVGAASPPGVGATGETPPLGISSAPIFSGWLGVRSGNALPSKSPLPEASMART